MSYGRAGIRGVGIVVVVLSLSATARGAAIRTFPRRLPRGVTPGVRRRTQAVTGDDEIGTMNSDALTSSEHATTVMLVDDHPSFRAAARWLLETEGYLVVAEAATGESALAMVAAAARHAPALPACARGAYLAPRSRRSRPRSGARVRCQRLRPQG